MEEDQKKEYIKEKADQIYKILKYRPETEIELGVNLYFSGNNLDILAAKIAHDKIDSEKRSKLERETEIK